MHQKNYLSARIIFAVYLVATCALLFFGYSVQKPAVSQQEFPFTITYSYQGETETISDVYVGTYTLRAKYIGDSPRAWYGYVKDRNRLESDFYRVAGTDSGSFSINLNLVPGYLMGDPQYAALQYAPTGAYHSWDGETETIITDPAELEQMGFRLLSWEYPEPIENKFSFGGLSLSSEAALYTTVLAAAALLACMILVRKDAGLVYSKLDKFAIVLNFLIAIVAFPFIFMVSALSEIVADTSVWQQILYVAPALTVLGIAASVAMRRCGYQKQSLFVQFLGPVLFGLAVLVAMP